MGEFFKGIQATLTQLDTDIRATLRQDPGTLGHIANTVYLDKTPMRNRIEGETNAITGPDGNPVGQGLTRRDFLGLGALTVVEIVATSCLSRFNRVVAPHEATTVPLSPTPTLSFIEQGIQYNDVAVLDEAATLAEAKNANIPLEDSYTAFINILQNKQKFPQLETQGAAYDRFSIVVPNVTGMKMERFSYNFLGMRTKDGNHSYVFMFVPWLTEDGKTVKGFKVVSLDPTEITDAQGVKRGTLAVFKDPATEQAIEAKPVFIFPTDIASWRMMTPEQRQAATVQFVPYNLTTAKDIKISGGKLAKMVIMNPVILTPTPKPTDVPPTAEPTKVVEKIANVSPEYWGTVFGGGEWYTEGTTEASRIPASELWRFKQNQDSLIKDWTTKPEVSEGIYPHLPGPYNERLGIIYLAGVNMGCYAVSRDAGGTLYEWVIGIPFVSAEGTRGANYIIQALGGGNRYTTGPFPGGVMDNRTMATDKPLPNNRSAEETCQFLENNIGHRVVVSVATKRNLDPGYGEFMTKFIEAIKTRKIAPPSVHSLKANDGKRTIQSTVDSVMSGQGFYTDGFK